MPTEKQIRAGMGGWTFEPWDESFYPGTLAKAKQLQFASRQVPTIEVNGTFYSTFKPATFAKWAAETPDDFIFSLKAVRYATNRKILAEAGESVARFLGSGISELGAKLGPILWQFAPTKKFDADDFGAFLALLPDSQDGVKLSHAVEVRTDSFKTPDFITLARKHKVAIVYADHEKYPAIADVTGDFVYARLQTGADDIATCYAPEQLDQWAARARLWASGKTVTDLPLSAPDAPAKIIPRDVFVYFISSGKTRAPHGAIEFNERVVSLSNQKA
ncbi:DUF72 domain-containing protein [Mesorhizobium sp. NBSH29]|uniref:DUF72 domain-containing protein n=1 Tax=Mesorhizobium sp. NBSH29 TaxID=2654249 RepID=UPI00189686FE|nr:DUF72 domain-containing protein [Mesorhizobium sp. NBSH29]QPC87806.1 DUF72 domain-containing protein [Mesorhizobium sp. NBSH29]